jgi:hypothetical protein
MKKKIFFSTFSPLFLLCRVHFSIYILFFFFFLLFPALLLLLYILTPPECGQSQSGELECFVFEFLCVGLEPLPCRMLELGLNLKSDGFACIFP